ncbi:S8 family serine peptidase [Mesorhizobium sp. L48C026A00]|uniref:S8 family serine peptidase n=1 Tax=Mesorhizobium sp. L48C026A00 TaxID=1287182 RepID=UPI0003D03DA6|nr:S8 family serine peptidase [Mesorhizobium sp. L48C026A00]ESZ10167.1 hypothetical protein X737_32205 [Mesorhizobium sp. L48C026A00]
MARRRKLQGPVELDYIIIDRAVDTSYLQGATESPALPESESTMPSVATAVATPQQAQAINSEAGRKALLNMPISLIEPCAAVDFGLQVSADAVGEAKAGAMAWGIASVGADQSMTDGAGVRVAILDTGIDATHQAFKGKTIVGRNFTGGDPDDFADRHGHGTHCAGTICGDTVDGVRIGVAPGVKELFVAKVLDDQGRGSTSGMLRALRWIADLPPDKPIHVISISLGFDFPGMVDRLRKGKNLEVRFATSLALTAYRETLKEVESWIAALQLENATKRGVIVVAASGNDSRADVGPDNVVGVSVPAACEKDIISVGAAHRGPSGKLRIAPFSNVGPRLSAPGVDIVSARKGGGLVAMNGTSMACPHVAGLAALRWQNEMMTNEQATASNVRAALVANSRSTDFDADVTQASRGRGMPRAP